MNKGGPTKRVSKRTLTQCAIGLVALAGAGLGAVLAQQPAGQMPGTKVTQLMTQAIAEFPGHEVMMITLDLPPGGGSQAHRHPGHHNFGYVLEGAYKIKLDNEEFNIHEQFQVDIKPDQVDLEKKDYSDKLPQQQ